MTDLKKFIHDHRDEFDDMEPDPNHFNRFEERLSAMSSIRPVPVNRFQMLRIAALILVLISVSVFVFDLATREIRERFGAQTARLELPVDVKEAILYYDNQSAKQLAEISKLAGNNPAGRELSASAMKEIDKLDENTNELKGSLLQNPNNERLLAALIQNQQMKDGILSNIVSKLTIINK